MASAGRRAFAGSGPRIGESGKYEGEFKVQTNAPYIQHRLDVWDRLYKKYQGELAAKPRKAITVELPDGKRIDGEAFQTTPMDIAMGISKGLAEAAVVAKLVYSEAVESLKQVVAADMEDDEPETDLALSSSVLWDMTRPLEGSCRMELLKFDHVQGQDVFWHSSAHILGQAMERKFGCHLTIGPALKSGFYYDGFFGPTKLAESQFADIEKEAGIICKENQPFQRCVLTKEEALELFSENPFKVQLITNKVPEGAMTSCYRCGPLIDLCRGPHIPSTGKAKAFMVTKNSAAYWLGDQKLDSLQRIYGIAFPSSQHLKDYKKFQEEAAKRDHRKIGVAQELFMQHPTASPGSTFWFPEGAKLYNRLLDLMRTEYRLRGFHEVITPNMYTAGLFMTSGHYQLYKDDMYSLDIEKQEWLLKPMNCPGHFLMFDHRSRSYKELPLRYADFGVLHRNEASGALSGLTRVRRFQQDDAHIFVRPDQIKDEVVRCLDFLQYIYNLFGFEASYALSTRPKKALGSKEIWDNAESQLKAALDKFKEESGNEWSLNPGDGAFYGPKIDIRLSDAMKRDHQCGTIQLDFNNPIRFNLQYRKEGADDVAEDGEDKGEFQGAVEKNEKGEVIWREGRLKAGHERPVVIHRAILGSIERMSAILTEHYAGKWPFWLSPRQVMVVPVAAQFNNYAQWVARQMSLHGFFADSDLSGKTLPKKVRDGQIAQWNYICVVGGDEAGALSVNVRQRDVEKPLGSFSMVDLIARLKGESMPSSQPLNQFEPFEGRLPEAAAAAAPAAAPAAASAAGAKSGAKSDTKPAPKGKDGAGDAKKDAGASAEAALETQPYVAGFKPSRADAQLFDNLSKSGFPETPNLHRWFEHIASFTAKERLAW